MTEPTYTATAGLDYADRRGRLQRVEAGTVARGLPDAAIGWLLAQGVIVPRGMSATEESEAADAV